MNVAGAKLGAVVALTLMLAASPSSTVPARSVRAEAAVAVHAISGSEDFLPERLIRASEGLARPTSPRGALVSCAGRANGSNHVSFSFDGLNVDWQRSVGSGKFVLREHGHVVIRTDSIVGFPVIITAPHTQGLICIAKMAGYTSPVVLYYVEYGASVGAELQALYPKVSGRYTSASFEAINRINPEIRVLGGSPALVLGDPRFDCLFVA